MEKEYDEVLYPKVVANLEDDNWDIGSITFEQKEYLIAVITSTKKVLEDEHKTVNEQN